MSAEPESARRDQRVHLIETVNRALADTTGVEDTLREAAHALVPELGDLAVVVIADGEGQHRLSVAHVQPTLQAAATRLVSQWLGPLTNLATRAFRAGITFRWLPDVNGTSALNAARGEPQVVRMLELLQVRSLMVVALQNGKGVLGAVAVARTRGDQPPYVGNELAVLQVVARRIALGVETARMQESMETVARRQSHLQEALETWTQVFHVAGWGAAIVDCSGRLIDVVNPAFARLHGYERPEDLGRRPFAELLPPDRAEEPETWEEEAGPRGRTYESVHRRADGRTFPVLVSVTPLTGGTRSSFVVTVQDLTDLKRAEDRLRRAQRMEAVGRLAGGVAHEVNNMMTIILGFSDLLARAPELAESLQRDVEEIRKAATRAGRITQQLLAFSRQQVLQPVELRVNAVVEELVPVLRLLLPANVRVEGQMSPIDAVVRADRAQLEQVLINLAFNARDAMPQGGTIRIATETRYLNEDAGRRLVGVAFPPGEYALVSVIDTGHGMDEATVEQVFEPFFTTKPLGLGTGLGLATVYGIVKQSGGYVWVESTPGEGTTFTVGLPLSRGARETAEPKDEPAAREPDATGTVLIVEDEDGVRQLAGRVLGARGYEVLEARNGEEALAAMGRVGESVDLVLTDVVVPDLSVGELARRIREAQGEVPILYMSGYPREEVIQRSLIDADQPFLQKPFTGDELADGVSRLLRGEHPVVEG